MISIGRLSWSTLGIDSPLLYKLTQKQGQAILTAYSLGYYDVPRRTSSEALANRLKLGTSTFAEHLRKAERNLLAGVLAA